MEPLKSIEAGLDGKSDYEILGHLLEFIGVCPFCTDAPFQGKGKSI
jgi:hypothetical protein